MLRITPDALIADAVKESYLWPPTWHKPGESAPRLAAAFPGLRLCDLTLPKIESYQISAAFNRSDFALLIEALKVSGCWTPPLADEVIVDVKRWHPNPVPLSKDRLTAFLERAQSNPSWTVLYLSSLVALGTAADLFDEIRLTRLKDIHLDESRLDIRQYVHSQARTVPLLGESVNAIAALMKRAHSVGSRLPEHYLIPYRAGSKSSPSYLANRPLSPYLLMRQWHEVSKDASVLNDAIWLLRPTALKLYPELRATAGHRYSDEPHTAFASIPNPELAEVETPATAEIKPLDLQALDPAARASSQTDEMEAMKKAAILVRDTGISIDTALQIVLKMSIAIDNSLRDVRRSASVAVNRSIECGTEADVKPITYIPQKGEA